MTSPGKYVYLICMTNSSGRFVYPIPASNLTNAIAAAQTLAGVSTDPDSTQKACEQPIAAEAA